MPDGDWRYDPEFDRRGRWLLWVIPLVSIVLAVICHANGWWAS